LYLQKTQRSHRDVRSKEGLALKVCASQGKLEQEVLHLYGHLHAPIPLGWNVVFQYNGFLKIFYHAPERASGRQDFEILLKLLLKDKKKLLFCYFIPDKIKLWIKTRHQPET